MNPPRPPAPRTVQSEGSAVHTTVVHAEPRCTRCGSGVRCVWPWAPPRTWRRCRRGRGAGRRSYCASPVPQSHGAQGEQCAEGGGTGCGWCAECGPAHHPIDAGREIACECVLVAERRRGASGTRGAEEHAERRAAVERTPGGGHRSRGSRVCRRSARISPFSPNLLTVRRGARRDSSHNYMYRTPSACMQPTQTYSTRSK